MNKHHRIEYELGLTRQRLAQLKSDITVLRMQLELKRIFREMDHPRWPAGTSSSRGGEFRPKDRDDDKPAKIATVVRNGMTIIGGWNEANRAVCGPEFDIDLALCVGAPTNCEDVAFKRFRACMGDMPIPRLGIGGR